MQGITPTELVELWKKSWEDGLYFGNILILDIRERPQFQQSNIASSINLHLSSSGEVVAVSPTENNDVQSSSAFQNSTFAISVEITFPHIYSSHVVIVFNENENNKDIKYNKISSSNNNSDNNNNNNNNNSIEKQNNNNNHKSYILEKTLHFVQTKSKLAATGLRPKVMFLEGGFQRFRAEYPQFCQTLSRPPIYAVERLQELSHTQMAHNLSDVPVQMLPHLYLCRRPVLEQKALLQSLGITHIINISSFEDTFNDSTFQYLSFTHIDDFPDHVHELEKALDQSTEFIENARKSGGKVLVHCQMGISRSSSIVLYYFMKHEKMTLQQALWHVKHRRPAVHPNAGFLALLSRLNQQLHPDAFPLPSPAISPTIPTPTGASQEQKAQSPDSTRTSSHAAAHSGPSGPPSGQANANAASSEALVNNFVFVPSPRSPLPLVPGVLATTPTLTTHNRSSADEPVTRAVSLQEVASNSGPPSLKTASLPNLAGLSIPVPFDTASEDSNNQSTNCNKSNYNSDGNDDNNKSSTLSPFHIVTPLNIQRFFGYVHIHHFLSCLEPPDIGLLSDTVWAKSFSHLTAVDLAQVSKTCPKWRKLVNESNLWSKVVIRRPGWSGPMTDEKLISLAQGKKGISSLCLNLCTRITNTGLRALGTHARDLLFLDLSSTAVDDDTLCFLMSNLPKLQDLNLSSTKIEMKQQLPAPHQTLSVLSLNWCSRIKIHSLGNFIGKCQKLVKVSLSFARFDVVMLQQLKHQYQHIHFEE